MKIVFLLRHALYLRNFETALRELARDGHEIVLVFSPCHKPVDTTLLTILKREYPNIQENVIAPRTGWWWPVSDAVRVMRDFLRYLEPQYENSAALVERGGRRLPHVVRWGFDRFSWLRSRPVRRGLASLASLLDRSIVPDPGLVEALKEWSPDLLLVTSVAEFRYHQTDYIKAARHLGIPTVLAVPSWDNLTNKGLIQLCPDRVIVWNVIQEREAIEMHRVPPERIRKTGAQLFDHWFEMTPTLDKGAFCAKVGGLDPSQPIILYLCSSTFICDSEVDFVRQWLSKLRECTDSSVNRANVVVRPHPAHVAQWEAVELYDKGPSAIWPREGGAPLDEMRKRDYFDSLYHASAVVGVNTSGFIEAGIVGRRTLALVTERFRLTQEGTLHFRYLVEGGLVQIGRSFDQHFQQLREAINDPEQVQEKVKEFITMFIRPAGIDIPTTPIFVDAVRSASVLAPQKWTTPFYAPLLRTAIWPIAFAVRRQVLARLNKGLEGGAERVEASHFLRAEDAAAQ